LLSPSHRLKQTSWPLFTLVGIILVHSLNTYTNADNNADAQSPTPSSPSSSTVIPAIQITSPQEGQQIPPGELTIQGTSSDDENTNCRVYADVNDITPMRNVTAAGDSKKNNDFSKWSFTYTPEYQLIRQGENELTGKITCLNERNPNTDALLLTPAPQTSSSPLSKWHTVNVTGVVGTPSITQPLPSAENGEGLLEEIESEDSEEEDNGDSFFGDDSFFE
jgi:hypothetical protein